MGQSDEPIISKNKRLAETQSLLCGLYFLNKLRAVQ